MGGGGTQGSAVCLDSLAVINFRSTLRHSFSKWKKYLIRAESGISHNPVQHLSESKDSLCANVSPQIFLFVCCPTEYERALPFGWGLVAFPLVIALMWSRSCSF